MPRSRRGSPAEDPQDLLQELEEDYARLEALIACINRTNCCTLVDGVPLSDLLAHLDGLLELGGEKAVGFGSDFDGIDAWPQGLEGPACLPALADLIARQGYAGEVVAGVAGENLWRLYRRAQGD